MACESDFSTEDLASILAAHCPHKPTCTTLCQEAEESYDYAMWEMAN